MVKNWYLAVDMATVSAVHIQLRSLVAGHPKASTVGCVTDLGAAAFVGVVAVCPLAAASICLVDAWHCWCHNASCTSAQVSHWKDAAAAGNVAVRCDTALHGVFRARCVQRLNGAWLASAPPARKQCIHTPAAELLLYM